MSSDYINNVTPYKFCRNRFTPILPVVYSEALSYMEALAEYCAKLNEVIEMINSFETEILAEANAYTDEKVNAQTQLVENAVADVNALAIRLQLAFDNLVTQVEEDYEKLKEDTEASIQASNARTDLRIAENNEWILEHMSEELASIKVVNYFTGEKISVQDMFDYLATFHLENAITYNQLYAKDITYSELIALNMTYTQLATNGNIIIT